MSNSSRIETATRSMVGAVLTSKMVVDAVKLAFPDYTGGVYPSDSAYKRDADGNLAPRGKVAYGDGILEFLAENSFKVLSDAEIVRKPTKRVAKPVVAATPPEVLAAPVVAAAPVAAPVEAVAPVAAKVVAKKKKSKKQAA
jgi:hypothetical protein